MNMKRQLISKLKDQKGASAIIIGVALVMLIGFAAIAIDIGYLYSTRNELQNIADASALAGAGLLGDVYAHLTSAEQQTYACGDQNTISDSFENDCDSIINRAQDVVGSSKNLAGGEDIVIDPNEVKIGDWNSASRTFTEFTNLTTLRPNAVKVVARRDTSRVNTSVATFFARIFNVDSVAVSAEATAALTGVSIEDEGTMNLPIGLSWTQFYENCAADPLVKRSGICSDLIEFSPTPSSCAGWHNFRWPANASQMRSKQLEIIVGHPSAEGETCLAVPCGETWLNEKFGTSYTEGDGVTTPETTANETAYFFQGGDVSTLFNNRTLAWEAYPTGSKNYVTPVMDGGNQVVDGSGQVAAFPALFDYFRFRDGDGVTLSDGSVAISMDENGVGHGIDLDGDGTDDITDPDAIWTATAPVYEDECPCANPNEELTIVGFAKVQVIMPQPPPNSNVVARVDCSTFVDYARGGGTTFGSLMGSIPQLVE